MDKITQERFESQISLAIESEPMRFGIYNRALKMIDSGFEIEAYLLILATWNFARFRIVVTTFDLVGFRATMRALDPEFTRLSNVSLRTADIDAIADDIKAVYSRLKAVVEQTGASKIMHFKQPELFVMWDTAIRKQYRVPVKCSPDDYIDFLKHMKKEFAHLEWSGRDRTFAKAIDEYNFGCFSSKNRKQKQKKKTKK